MTTPCLDNHARALILVAFLANLVISAAAAADDETKGETGKPAIPENKASVLELPKVEVIGTTPLPGIGIPLEQVPANIQSAPDTSIKKQPGVTIADYLENNVGSVNVNAAQNNPFQLDVNFRGFTASPLLGTPQGLSVFQDGVRVNEPFGDLVNWDLIPQAAIANIQVIPGSNPLFGLNTLGGALAIQTKSGFQFPGYGVRAYGGSFGRQATEFEAGGHGDSVDYFVAGNLFHEDGWREHSSSRVKQLFTKVGYQDERTDLDLSGSFADNRLEGVQALPTSFLDDRSQAYTWPDYTSNRLQFLNLKASHFLSDEHLLAGNVYYRALKTFNFSSNVNDQFDGVTELNPAINNTNTIDQTGYGGSFQYTFLGPLAGYQNQFVAGVSVDLGDTDFSQFAQPAGFSPDRGTTVILGPFEQTVLVSSKNRYHGAYFADTLAFNERWSATLSGRYNRARVTLHDESGTDPALDGDHTFHRFNPALGVTFNPSKGLTAYAAYNEGMRVPSPVELTCADPTAPCNLPNDFLADPALKPVISKTSETGVRGSLGANTTYSAALFRTELKDDIQFISSGGGTVNAGFFQNIGDTRREGIELGFATRQGSLNLSARYSLVNATFQAPITLHSPDNSNADAGGDIHVQPGNRVPGIPRHTLKVRVEYGFGDNLFVGANIYAASSQYARGDENNQDANGRVPGYAVVNMDAHYQLTQQWQLFAKVTNLFNRDYETLGVLGRNFFTGPGMSFDPANARSEQFLSPAPPRGIWVGLHYQFGAAGPGSRDVD